MKTPFPFLTFISLISVMGLLTNCEQVDEVAPSYQDPGVNTYTVILIGNQLSSEPSFYGSSTNSRYTLSEAKTHAESVDFGYANGHAEGNEYFIGAPDDESMMFIYDNPSTGIQTWLHRNSTRFKTTALAPQQFDTVSKASTLIQTFAKGQDPFSSSRVRESEIQVNNVVAFATEEGKRGLFKVIARSGSPNTAGTITLNVKVEKNRTSQLRVKKL